MATRKSAVAVKPKDELPAIEGQYEILPEDGYSFETISPGLSQLYAEMGVSGDGSLVFVSLLNSDGQGKEAQIWRGPPDDYDLESLVRKFGSNDYRVKLYVTNETGQRVMKGQRIYTWKLSPEDEQKRTAPVTIAQPQINASDIARAVAEAVRAALPATAPIDPMAQMRQMAEIMHLMNPHGSAPVHQQDQLGSLRTAIELMQMIKGDSEPIERGVNATGTDLLMKVVDKFGPLLGSALTQPGGVQSMMGLPTQPMPAIGMTPAQSAPGAQPAPPATMTPEDEEMNMQQMKLKMGLNFLVGQCEAGGAPETYAEVVLDSVPEEAVAQFVADVPKALEYLGSLDKRVTAHTEWFTRLFDTIKEMTAPEPAEPEAVIDPAKVQS
jgi:hypothetical protein